MIMKKRRIGILTSGGDCPGLNAVIRGVVRAADKLEWEVVGFREGFEGLLPPGDSVILDKRSTAGIMLIGGTILGTTNRGHFVSKTGMGEKASISPEVIRQARQVLENLSIDALVVVGGDGSLSTAQQLFEAGFPIVGVPKTIDNDLESTAMTVGFDSAVACVVAALDRLHTTASSHKRVMVLEVMGRHAGWIALHGGLAGGADVILIPELPFDLEKVAEVVRQRDSEGALSTMIVVVEGAWPINGHPMAKTSGAGGEAKLGGIAEFVAHEVNARTGKEARTCVLGHLQRGGPPTALDRILGTRFGIKAVSLIEEGKFGRMASYQDDRLFDVSIKDAVHRLRCVQPRSELVQAARAVGISFGD